MAPARKTPARESVTVEPPAEAEAPVRVSVAFEGQQMGAAALASIEQLPTVRVRYALERNTKGFNYDSTIEISGPYSDVELAERLQIVDRLVCDHIAGAIRQRNLYEELAAPGVVFPSGIKPADPKPEPVAERTPVVVHDPLEVDVMGAEGLAARVVAVLEAKERALSEDGSAAELGDVPPVEIPDEAELSYHPVGAPGGTGGVGYPPPPGAPEDIDEIPF